MVSPSFVHSSPVYIDLTPVVPPRRVAGVPPVVLLVLLNRIQARVEWLMEELLEEWLLALARRPLGAQFSAAGMCALAIEQFSERFLYE